MWAACWMALAASMPGAVPGVVVPLNQGQSYVQITLRAQGEEDTDTSPISGHLVIELDPRSSPTAIALQNFDGMATQSLNFSLSYGPFGLLGSLNATATGLRLIHADPGPARFWPAPGGIFDIPGVPYYKEGLVNYTATGLVCTSLSNSGLPCNDTRNLANEPLALIDVPGTVQVINGTVYITATLDIYFLVDGTNPANGEVDGFAYLVGSAPIPLTPDFDDDGDVDLTDFAHVQTCLSGKDVPQTLPACQDARLDLDDDVDDKDMTILQACLSGANIPASADCLFNAP